MLLVDSTIYYGNSPSIINVSSPFGLVWYRPTMNTHRKWNLTLNMSPKNLKSRNFILVMALEYVNQKHANNFILLPDQGTSKKSASGIFA